MRAFSSRESYPALLHAVSGNEPCAHARRRCRRRSTPQNNITARGDRVVVCRSRGRVAVDRVILPLAVRPLHHLPLHCLCRHCARSGRANARARRTAAAAMARPPADRLLDTAIGARDVLSIGLSPNPGPLPSPRRRRRPNSDRGGTAGVRIPHLKGTRPLPERT